MKNSGRFTDERADQIIKGWICAHGTTRILQEAQDFTCSWLSRQTASIFEACRAIEAKGKHPDIITINEALSEAGTLDEVGGAAAIMPGHEVWEVVQSAIDSLRKCYQRREMDSVATGMVNGSLDITGAIRSLEELREMNDAHSGGLFAALEKCSLPFPSLKLVDIPPRRGIVGDWFKESDLGFVYAPRGVGKTWFALALASSIAGKESFGPWKIHDRPRILIVDGEMPVETVKQRLDGLGGADESIRVLNHETLFHKTGKTLNLADRESQNHITRLCVRHQIGILILDNLSCLFRGVAENEADAWEIVLPWLLNLRRNRVAVVIVAHAGRNGQMRGTSRREDQAFWVVKLEESTDSATPRAGARFLCRFTKDRNSRTEQSAMEWTFTTGDDGKVSISVKEADGTAVLIEWVRDGLTGAREIGAEMGLSPGAVSKMAKRAIEAGRLKKEGRGYAIP